MYENLTNMMMMMMIPHGIKYIFFYLVINNSTQYINKFNCDSHSKIKQTNQLLNKMMMKKKKQKKKEIKLLIL